MNSFLNHFAADESGATAIEYGLIATLISAALVAALTGIGSGVTTAFTSVNSALSH